MPDLGYQAVLPSLPPVTISLDCKTESNWRINKTIQFFTSICVRIIIEFLSQSFILNLNDFNKVSMISIGQTSNFHGAWNQPCHHDQESCTEAILMLNSAWLPTSGLSHCAYCASNSIYYALLQLECMAWYKGEQSFAWNTVISGIGLE